MESSICTLSNQEKMALTQFFRILLNDMSAGYVLYGNKPIFIGAIFNKVHMYPLAGSRLHRFLVCQQEGIRVWKKLALLQKNSKFLIQFFETPNSTNFHTIAIINKPVFLKVVQDNILLFQYVLGPKTTPQTLLKKIENGKESFSNIFQDNKVLMGIVLGYGTQNALSVSRAEYIEQFLYKKDQKVSTILPYTNLEHKKRYRLYRTQEYDLNYWESMQGKPSFGYDDLLQELQALRKDTKTTIKEYQKDSPKIPWFGYIESKETKKIINHYLSTRKKIIQVLHSENFLLDVLKKIMEPYSARTLIGKEKQIEKIEEK